jgi:hypothetical protein
VDIQYTVEQHVFLYESYVKCGSARKFLCEIPRITGSSTTGIQELSKLIAGPVFCVETINSDRYVRLLLTEFFAQLTEERQSYVWFQQLPTLQTIL